MFDRLYKIVPVPVHYLALSAMEGTPLLAADPPIDDDSYNIQPQSLPSLEQKHLLYAWHVLSTALSGSSFYANILAIALLYHRDFIPVTFFALVPLVLSNIMESCAANLVEKARLNRLFVTTGATVGERVCQVLFCTLLLRGKTWKLFSVCVVLYLVGRTLRFVVRQSLELDWALILANDQPSLHRRVLRHLNDISYRLSMILPLITAFVIQYVGIDDSLRLLRVASIMILLVELSMIRGLYSTCYALHLPTSYTLAAAAVQPETTPTSSQKLWAFSWSRPSLMRLLRYMREVPRPIFATVGFIITRASLLTIGPQVTWYLLHEQVPLIFVGFLRTVLAIDLLSDSIPPILSSFLIAIGSFFCCLTVRGNPFWFGCAALLSRLGVRKTGLLAESIVEESGIDESAMWFYDHIETSMQTLADVLVISLTLVWTDARQFNWPVYISASGSFIGLCLIAGAYIYPNH